MAGLEFLSLMQKIPVAVYECTGNPDWDIKFLNNSIFLISGYALSYFSGDNSHDYTSIIHPEDLVIRQKTIRNRTGQGKKYVVEYRIVHANGHRLWVREEGFPLCDDLENVHFTGAISDVTHKKKVLEIFRLNESRLSALLDLNQMTNLPLNEITGYALEKAIELTRSKVGYCAFVNKEENIIRMYSWSTQAIKNCHIKHKQNTYHIDHMGLWGEAIRQRKPIITNNYTAANPLKRGQPEGHVKIQRHMNVPVFDQGRIIIIAGVGNKKDPYDQSDVRQVILMMEGMWNMIRRKEIEENLRHSELKYRSIFEYAGAPSLIIEDDMTISMANLKFEQFSGYRRRDIENRITLSGLIDREAVTNLKQFKSKCTQRSKNAPFEYECKFKDSKGREKDIAIRLGVLPEQGRCIASFFDITASKLAQARLREKEVSLRRENILLKSDIQKRYGFGRIVGKSPAMQEVYNSIIEAGASNASVIVYGESGTGKELISRAIHEISSRSEKPFVSVNCGAIPDHLLESEFFGNKKGAFTGAYSDRIGYMGQAEGGTLFLDEIGELDLHMQIKLLRAIEGNGYTPVGGVEVIISDLRIIAATNRDLFQHVNEGRMRKDFFYRIHILPVELPPLRKRKEDIPLLIDDFFQKNKMQADKRNLFTPEVTAALESYEWPGNIRELHNVLHRFITLSRLDFGPGKKKIPIQTAPSLLNNSVIETGNIRQLVRRYEKNIILTALEKNKWNRTRSAAELHINRKTLFKKMKAFGLV